MGIPVPRVITALGSELDRRIHTSRLALWLAAALPLFALYLATLRTNVHYLGIDSIAVTPSAWELAHHGTPRLPADGSYYGFLMVDSGPGHLISNRPPGLIGLAALFYRILPSAQIYNVAPASIAAAVVTSAAMGTLALVLARLASSRVALVAAWIAGTATSTWAVSGTALWPHSADQLYLAAAMLAVATRRYALAGVAFALGVITRPPLGVAAAVAGMWASVRERSPRPALLLGLVAAFGLVGYLLYAREFWGGGLQSGYTSTGDGGDFVGNFWNVGPRGIWDFVVNIVGTVVSPGRGVLLRSPLLVALLPGLRAAWRSAPDWVRNCAVGGIVYLAVQLKSNRFGGGGHFWGYRYPIETLTLLAPLLLLAWRCYAAQTARRRAALAALTVVSIAFQALGALCFRTKFYFSDWTPYNFVWAIRERPIVAAIVLGCGYLGATAAYWIMSRAGSGTPAIIDHSADAVGAGKPA